MRDRTRTGPGQPSPALLCFSGGRLDFLQLFVTGRAQLEEQFPRERTRIQPEGILWVCWPKMSSPLKGDLNENDVRAVGLANGLVDVKVAAIDQDWSGLKFVYRLADRP